MIWSAVILNQAYRDVLGRHGEEAAEAFLAEIDPKVLFFAAAYHDCGRQTDWGYHTDEMRKHGPRGAALFDEKSEMADPTLEKTEKAAIVALIHKHTRTASEAKAIRSGRLDGGNSYEDYNDPQLLMLRLLQDADALGLTRTWYSMDFNKLLSPIAARVRAHRVERAAKMAKPGYIGNSLHFPRTAELIPIAHRLAWTDRHDPDIVRLFPDSKAGAAMESAERLGILKP